MEGEWEGERDTYCMKVSYGNLYCSTNIIMIMFKHFTQPVRLIKNLESTMYHSLPV